MKLYSEVLRAPGCIKGALTPFIFYLLASAHYPRCHVITSGKYVKGMSQIYASCLEFDLKTFLKDALVYLWCSFFSEGLECKNSSFTVNSWRTSLPFVISCGRNQMAWKHSNIGDCSPEYGHYDKHSSAMALEVCAWEKVWDPVNTFTPSQNI